MAEQSRHFETKVSGQWGGRAKVRVSPTTAGDYVVEIRPNRSRSVVRAELGTLVEIALERDAKVRAAEGRSPRRRVRRSVL